MRSGGRSPPRVGRRHRSAQRPLARSAVGAHPGNGAFHLSRDFRANSARANSQMRPRSNSGNRTGRRACARTRWRSNGPRRARRPKREPSRSRWLTGNWLLPPITPIRGLAPSTHLRIPGQMARAPIPGFHAVELSQITLAKAVAPGPNDSNNAREWWRFRTRAGSEPSGRPAIGAFHRYQVGQTNKQLASRLRARSTIMRKEYDFSKSRPNPYASRLKRDRDRLDARIHCGLYSWYENGGFHPRSGL